MSEISDAYRVLKRPIRRLVTWLYKSSILEYSELATKKIKGKIKVLRFFF
jgi:hypothetical protein